MRSAVNQASNAANQANATGQNYGASAAGVNSQLLPFLTRELNDPQGYTQQQTAGMLGSAMGGAGGSTAGLTTEANLASARARNSGGFPGALDQAARQQGKNLAGISEGIAGQNANLQQENQQRGASGLSNLYGTDVNAQMRAMGLIPEDINAEVGANKTGWFQNMNELLQTLNGSGSSAAQMKSAGMFA
jgi:hypothetical protein